MSDTTPLTRLAHQRLDSSAIASAKADAYHVALELFQGVERVATTLPQGHGELKDQLRRAAGATVRNIAEGANRIRATRSRASPWRAESAGSAKPPSRWCRCCPSPRQPS